MQSDQGITVLDTTKSVCPVCLNIVEAAVIVQEKPSI